MHRVVPQVKDNWSPTNSDEALASRLHLDARLPVLDGYLVKRTGQFAGRPGAILAAMLHSMRRRMRDLVEREAAGESVWTEGFDERIRTRIRHAWEDDPYAARDANGICFVRARQMILRQEGIEHLSAGSRHPYDDFNEALNSTSDDMYPTVLEALVIALDEFLDWDFDFYGQPPADGVASRFVAAVNEIFSQERVAWRLVDRMMVEMKSMEMHGAIVEPTLRLLHEGRFSKVDAAYRKALDELSRGDPADAVTDAGRALQELLTELGCQGNALGDLIKSARRKGLLAAHDVPTLDALEKSLHWVAADRSETGDSHHLTDASRDDAWLIVHVVGAFVVRLAAGGTRG